MTKKTRRRFGIRVKSRRKLRNAGTRHAVQYLPFRTPSHCHYLLKTHDSLTTTGGPISGHLGEPSTARQS